KWFSSCPKYDILTVRTPATGLSHGTPGLDQVGFHRSLRVQFRSLMGHLRPTPVRFGLFFGRHSRLREVIVGHIDLTIDRVHGPGNLIALEIFLLKNNPEPLFLPRAWTIEHI